MAYLNLRSTMMASRGLHPPRAAAAARACFRASAKLRPSSGFALALALPLPNLYRPQQQSRQDVRVQALPNIGKLFDAANLLRAIQTVWDKYDVNDDNGLTLEEVVSLLNSNELCDYVEQSTNVRPPQRTAEQVRPLFEEADADKNKRLSRPEFVALYAKLVLQRIKTEPKVLLQALLGAIDWNRDGSINGTELKRLLKLAGIPGLATTPIPDNLALDYTKATSLLGLPPPAPRSSKPSA